MSGLNSILKKLTKNGYGKITFTNDVGHNQWWCTNAITHQFEIGKTPEEAAQKLLEAQDD